MWKTTSSREKPTKNSWSKMRPFWRRLGTIMRFQTTWKISNKLIWTRCKKYKPRPSSKQSRKSNKFKTFRNLDQGSRNSSLRTIICKSKTITHSKIWLPNSKVMLQEVKLRDQVLVNDLAPKLHLVRRPKQKVVALAGLDPRFLSRLHNPKEVASLLSLVLDPNKCNRLFRRKFRTVWGARTKMPTRREELLSISTPQTPNQQVKSSEPKKSKSTTRLLRSNKIFRTLRPPKTRPLNSWEFPASTTW